METKELIKFRLIGEREKPKEFSYPPMGWQDIGLSFKRDYDVHGVFLVSSLPVKFQDGYKDYIKDQYEKYGIKANISIEVYFLDESDNYNLVFKGYLDLTTLIFYKRIINQTPLEEKPDDYLFCECKVESLHIGDKLKQRAGIETSLANRVSAGGLVLQELNMPTNVIYHSQALFEYDTYAITNNGIQFVGIRGYAEFESEKIQLIYAPSPYWIYQNPTAWVIQNKTDFPLKVKITIKGVFAVEYKKVVNGNAMEFAFYWKRSNVTAVNDLLVFTLPNSANNIYDYRDIDLTTTVTIDADEKLFAGIMLRGNIAGVEVDLIYNFLNAITLRYESVANASIALSWLAYEAFERLIGFCTDKDNRLISNTLGRLDSVPKSYSQNGKASLIAIINGLTLRNSPQKKEPELSFKTLFDSFNALFCLGFSEVNINNEEFIIVENREDFYNDEVLWTFNKIPDITLIIWKDGYYQRVKVGFNKYELDETKNTIDEFNTERIFFNELYEVNNQYDAMCELIASGYAIERTRRSQFEKDSKQGDRYDEDNFAVSVFYDYNLDVYISERDGFLEDVENLDSPETRYNIRLSPTRIFTRHAKWFNGSFFRNLNGLWKYGKGKGNVRMLSQDTDDTDFADKLTENQDFKLSQIDPCLYQPEIVSFKAPFDVKLWNLLLDGYNRFKLIRVSHTEADHLEGWIDEISVDVENWTFDVKLLRKNTGFIADGLPPIVPPPPSQRFAQMEILGTELTQNLPNFTYIPNQPTKVGFKYNNGANDFFFQATVSNLDAFLPLIYNDLIANPTIMASYDVYLGTTSVLIKAKLPTPAFNFGTTVIDSITNITAINGIAVFINF